MSDEQFTADEELERKFANDDGDSTPETTLAQEESDNIGADIEKAFAELESKGRSPVPSNENNQQTKGQPQNGQEITRQKTSPQKAGQEGTQEVKQPQSLGLREEPSEKKLAFGPKSWDANDKKVFELVPPEIREKIQAIEERRDRQMLASFTRATMEVREVAQKFSQLEDTLSPYRAEWAAQGISDHEAIGALIEAHNVIKRDPAAAIKKLAENYQIDLGQLASGEIESTPQYFDPRVDEMLARQRAEEESRLIEQNNSILSTVESFAEETDINGNRLRPDFDLVHEDMKPIVAMLSEKFPQAAPREILQEAYDRALRANPTTWQRLQQADSTKLLREKQQRAAQAKSRAVSVVGSPGSGNVSRSGARPDSIEAAIEQAMIDTGFGL